jgi:pseudouridine-5'-phosphate glycosidase
VTPFLLRDLAARSGGATLRANVALLLNNAAAGAAIAIALASEA